MDSNTVKVVKILGESKKGWTQAADNAVRQADKTIKNISGIKVLEMSANIEEGEIKEYKTTLEVAFPVLNKKDEL
ncbi:MAG: dodecin family protein [Bacillota bacterium]